MLVAEEASGNESCFTDISRGKELREGWMYEDFTVIETDGSDLLVNFLMNSRFVRVVQFFWVVKKRKVGHYLLTVALFTILSFSSMYEGCIFVVKTM